MRRFQLESAIFCGILGAVLLGCFLFDPRLTREARIWCLLLGGGFAAVAAGYYWCSRRVGPDP